MRKRKIAIIGAGAAGCFCAVNAARMADDVEIDVFESGQKPLAKVALTGGGRCNLTNTFRDVTNLAMAYPRGERLMQRALRTFSPEQTYEWFENEGVKLTVQVDQCVFPVSQDSMQIVNTLTHLMRQQGIRLHTSHKLSAVEHSDEGYMLTFANGQTATCDILVLTMGGLRSFDMLGNLSLRIEKPVPSLFTFALADVCQDLMGTVVEDATVSLAGTKFRACGPLLMTHWGMSGPAILKLSSYAARHLADGGYKATLAVNWLSQGEDFVCGFIGNCQKRHADRQMANEYPRELTSRLWNEILHRSGIDSKTRWKELNKKQVNKLVETLTNDQYEIKDKFRYKEEFVTCGGISLKEININTLECRKHPGLYIAGECLDVDAITGGFNLQAAWSMGYVIALQIAREE